MIREIDRSIVGEVFDDSVSEPVTLEDVLEFSASVGETNPRFTGPDAVAPPTFCVRFRGNRFFHPKIPAELLMTGFDAGKDIAFGVPIRPGDSISTRNVLHDVYEKTGRSGTMIFLVSRQTLTNQEGEVVATVDSRFVLRPERVK